MNNIYSMWLAIKELQEDFICVYGDLMFDEKILKKCLGIKSEIGLMIETNTRDETMKVKIENESVTEINKKIDKMSADGNFIGMAKFSNNGAKKLFTEIDMLIKEKKDGYYTVGIENLIRKKTDIGYQITDDLSWMDIDEETELKESHKIFHSIGDIG